MTAWLPVLMYHAVDDSGGRLSVPPAEFDRQMSWLASEGYQTLGATEIEAFLTGTWVPSRKVVVITFDDGLASNWHHAYPILARHGLRALLFAVTGWLGDGAPRSNDGKEHGDERCLRWSEVSQMVDSGAFELHSHTHSHLMWWERSSDPAECWANLSGDIAESLRALRERGFQGPIHLAWPWGHYRQAWIEPARQLGITALYTIRKLTNRSGDGLGAIRRIDVVGPARRHFDLAVSLASNGYSGPLLNGLFSLRSRMRSGAG
jgi:peptidoglycan/xylan/chitin deacetylase (PgdA/CDA1 family)